MQVTELDGAGMSLVLVQDSVQEPRAIALHPGKG